MACCDLLLVWCRCLQSSAKCKYTHYRSTYCLGLRGADVKMWDCDRASREFGPSCERTGEPLNSHSRILAPNWREITGVDCTFINLRILVESYMPPHRMIAQLRTVYSKIVHNCYWYTDYTHCSWINNALVTRHKTWSAYENYVWLTVTSS